jgi:hypothetical protein
MMVAYIELAPLPLSHVGALSMINWPSL